MTNTVPAPWQDEASFEDVYRSLFPVCRRLVARTSGSVALRWHIPQDAYQEMVTDAVHDSFIQVSRTGWDENKSSLLRWLVVIAKHRLQRFLAVTIQVQRYRAELDARPERASVPVDDAVGRRAHIDQTMLRLHRRHAQVLQAHYLEQRSVRAIAVELEVTETTVQSLLQRGRGRFKDLWVQWEAEPCESRKEYAP